MPTISFAYRDFENLLGRNLPVERFREMALLYAKAEVDEYDKKSGEVKVSLDDTNLPYLWSVEGLARLFKGVLGIRKGLPRLSVRKGDYKVVVDASVRKCRPYIATFVAEGKRLDSYLLEQLVQLQEKFCESYGRRREKVSIGLYSHRKISFPVHYKAVRPGSVSFVPLESSESMDLSRILKVHQKGRQYGWILEKFREYPLLVDSKGEVLSFVPIINSDFTGRLRVGDSEMLFEATGTDWEAVNVAASIFAHNLQDRGFRIRSVEIEDGRKKFDTPVRFNEKVRLKREDVECLTGLKLGYSEIANLLERARYGVSGRVVSVPDYRRDILHIFDVVEDVAIMYGFDRIESAPLESYTIGEPTEMNVFAGKVREIAAGLGFQEVLSPVLSNRKFMEENMLAPGSGLVEIENVMSETYSAVRSWLTPVMLEVLSKNRHNDYPQRVFEEGVATVRKGGVIEDREKIAFAISHTTADFTEAKQVCDAVMNALGLKCSVKPRDGGSFIAGRAGSVVAGGKGVGFVGEISPEVLASWQLGMPVSVVELDLTELKKVTSSS